MPKTIAALDPALTPAMTPANFLAPTTCLECYAYEFKKNLRVPILRRVLLKVRFARTSFANYDTLKFTSLKHDN